ncbi:DUF3857 domain-containing protein [Thalassotalea fusca]
MHLVQFLKNGLYWLLVLLFTLVHVVSVQAADNEQFIQATPEWVEIRQPELSKDIPVDEISNGVFYHLIDLQFKVTQTGERAIYSRYVEEVINQTGVDYNSQLNLSFDPSYQQVWLNSLYLIRDGQKIDKLNTAKITQLNNENELNAQIYHGNLTLNVLIDDLREGDVLDYSYSRVGVNPIYQGVFSYSRTLNWSVPVAEQYVRILWGKNNPLFVSGRNFEPNVSQTQLGQFQEYSLYVNNPDTIRIPSETPNWYSPYNTVYFTELSSWRQVVDWAQPLYHVDEIVPEVQAVANDIKASYGTKSEQISAALKYVQNEIRYVALQNGINSHLPTPASETLALRYGDCKDKAILFISILKGLGVNAYPALVDTEETLLLNEKPPAQNRFDHVLVTLEHDNQRYWLDPTIRRQEGQLDALYQPDYGYALILAADQTALTSMKQATVNSYLHVNEQYSIPAIATEAVEFTVVSEYLGDEALAKRNQIEEKGRAKLARDYEVFYQKQYPELKATSELTVVNNEDSGVLSLTEHYSINNFWSKEEKDFSARFYPTDIRNAVFKPEEVTRNAPLRLTFPDKIKMVTQLTFAEDGWTFENETFTEDNDFFYFKKNVVFEGSTLTLTYDYQAKANHVPVAQIQEYLDARIRLRDEAYFGIIKYGDHEEVVASPKESFNYSSWVEIGSVVFLCAIGFIIISWRLESNARPRFEGASYYPISLAKFLTLSIATFGFYIAYWMYRNWKAVKQQQGSTIMPIARGIFSVFWFYPLFNQLKTDSMARFGDNRVMMTTLAILFALVYFVFAVGSNYVDSMAVSMVYLLLPLLFIPLVSYINLINQSALEAYRYNSKWHLRHIVAIMVYLPLLVFTLADESSLLPSDQVVTQEQILQGDIQFLQRKKLILPNETINYFYSDAIFSVRDDGNGFTDNRIFSYWLNEADEFQSEVVSFTEVKDIKVDFAPNDNANTVITVVRKDDSEFMLFVAPLEGKDRLFVNKLKSLWRKQKMSES